MSNETLSREAQLAAMFDRMSGNSGKTPLERYGHLLRPEQQAHEVGIERLAPQDRHTIDGVITELKRVIRP